MKIDKKTKRHIFEIIVFAGIVLWAVFNYTLFIDFIKYAINLAMPVIVGAAIAFIINVPMKAIEQKIFKVEKRKHKKLIRILSLVISIVLIVGILGLILFLVIPELVEAFLALAKTVPDNIKWVNKLIDKVNKMYPDLSNYVGEIDSGRLVEIFIGNANQIVDNVVAFMKGTISTLVTGFFGFIISLYILIDKENLVRQSRKLIEAIFDDKKTQTIFKIFRLTNDTFSKFITGQCLDAMLTGFEFFLVLWIVKVPYSVILGVLFAITALIPYVGAFITLVVGIILTAVVNPMYAVWYALIFFIVQQFDDNFTYPKIVGGKVGLPAIWALVAVLIGGSIDGVVGMIVSIPLASVLYTLVGEWVNKRIENKEKIVVKKDKK